MSSRNVIAISGDTSVDVSLRLPLETSKQQSEIASESVTSNHFERPSHWHILVMPVIAMIVILTKFKKLVYKKVFRVAPSVNSWWYDGLGDLNRIIKINASKWQSMDALYNYYERQHPNRYSISGLADFLWVGRFGNAKAVRNRFRIVRSWLIKALIETSRQHGGSIRIVSLACGSAQAVIEAVREVRDQGINAEVLLIDQDQESLDYALTLAEQAGIAESIKIQRVNVLRAANRLRDFAPHIVEMVGLADYFDDDLFVKYLTQIQANMPAGARFLTANIVNGNRAFHRLERVFLHTVVDWPAMVYRTPEGFAKLVSKANFTEAHSINEPMGIYTLVEAHKAEVV